MSRHLPTAAVAAALALAAGFGLSGCESGATAGTTLSAAAPADPHTLVATTSSCIGSWPAISAGPHTFTVANQTKQTIQLAFINAATGTIFGQVTQLDPGTTRPLQVDPPAGSYRFRCIPHRGDASVSATSRATGSGGSSVGALTPLSAEEIVNAVKLYRRGVHRGIGTLAIDTGALMSAVHRRNWALAKQRWLTAHLDFARLGAAYGTFGNLSDEIDGRADGLPLGVHDPSFTGFLAVERLLWHHASPTAITAAVGTLQADVEKLQTRFPHLKLVAGDLPLRAHEILENALEFELTGDTDEGSHTNLATVVANVQGTQLVMRTLTTALEQRRPELLTSVNGKLTAFISDLRAARSRSGRWPAVSALSVREREHLDSDIDGLLQQLSLMPGVLTLPVSLALP